MSPLYTHGYNSLLKYLILGAAISGMMDLYMEFLVFIVIVVLVITFLKSSGLGIREAFPSTVSVKKTSPYHYGRRKYLMTQSENKFFRLLVDSAGDRVNVFPQVRLSSLLYRTKEVERRYWHAALARINQKSVDYVLCDKLTGETLLVIELDDITHDTVLRQKRDDDVNQMLQEAGVPFMRFRNIANLTHDILRSKIYEVLPQAFEHQDTYSLEKHSY